ncbi:MAG TPA: response regulator transcription factor [Phycisphaerales bacterium]|nr:response regulator transcription factor [Phycisphaerales bacterium]
MNNGNQQPAVTVLVVDDNLDVADALRTRLSRTGGFACLGALPSADDLIAHAERVCPMIVLLDIDMPGKSPFDALAELAERCPASRAVMFTGHVRRELIEKALDNGAWGYVSKNDGEDELISALMKVAAGEFALGPEARRLYDSGI